MTHLEEIEKIIEQAQKSGESAFITALKVTNVYERVTDHQVHILSGNICLTMRAADGATTCGECGQTGITGNICPNCGARKSPRR